MKLLFIAKCYDTGSLNACVAIARGIERVRPEWSVDVASYSLHGLELNVTPHKTIMMAVTNNSLEGLCAAAYSQIRGLAPNIVIAYEDCASIIAASLLSKKSIAISGFFPENPAIADILVAVEQFYLSGDPGVYYIPEAIRNKTKYCPPVIGELNYGTKDRDRVRSSLGIQPGTFVTTINCDYTLPAAKKIFVELCLEGISCALAPQTVSYILNSGHAERLSRTTPFAFTEVGKEEDRIKYLVASDCLITTSNRHIALEAASCGIHSISFSDGTAPEIDVIMAKIGSNLLLNYAAAEPAIITRYLNRIISYRQSQGSQIPASYREGGETVARDIVKFIDGNNAIAFA